MTSNDRLFYPAVFHSAEEGGFWITFPDFPECMTQGDDMAEAYRMAEDALGLAIEDRLSERAELPEPTPFSSLDVRGGEYLIVISFDMQLYNRLHNSKAVKKTLSIPEWLNEESMAMGINFSQTLQEALLNKLSARGG
ncbi:MAG TPA: type II toxin-antitoxin system HicB family antitoxin [Candidatus Avilachnospira avicola]|nr:type II toxin-antitoxin system HicB family antitoxin [Candidatus Avilachnospira avicola]